MRHSRSRAAPAFCFAWTVENEPLKGLSAAGAKPGGDPSQTVGTGGDRERVGTLFQKIRHQGKIGGIGDRLQNHKDSARGRLSCLAGAVPWEPWEQAGRLP